jgi:endonuclease YncB( thermonuclease family)
MVKVRTLHASTDLYPAKVTRVVDGDTVVAEITLPFDTTVTRRIRLKGFWADELTGPYAVSGEIARIRLAQWLADKVIWLHSPSQRKDRYGRTIASLWHEGRIIPAKEILGDAQLTEAEHRRRKDLAVAAARSATAALEAKVGTIPPSSPLKSLLGPTEDQSDWGNIAGADDY